jgi:hypothetical protein
MSKINETTCNAPAIRDLADAELDGVNGGSIFSAVQEALEINRLPSSLLDLQLDITRTVLQPLRP